MKSYREIRDRSTRVRTLGIPKKTAFGTDSHNLSSLLFTLLKIAKEAENCKKTRELLSKELKDKTNDLKSLKKRYDAIKQEITKTKTPFLQKKDGKVQNEKENSMHSALEAKAERKIEEMDKFFEFDLEY